MHVYVPAVIAHRYIKSVTVWDLIVDDGLYIDRLQLELYGDINEPLKKKSVVVKRGNRHRLGGRRRHFTLPE